MHRQAAVLGHGARSPEECRKIRAQRLAQCLRYDECAGAAFLWWWCRRWLFCMTPEHAHIVQSTWRAVLPVGDTFAELFYGRLFALDPRLKKLFRDDPVEQGRNLTAMLSVAAANVGKPEKIVLALRQLGKRHVAYGVTPKDFANFEDALLFALEHALIDVFTPEVKAAWQAAYALLSSTMLEAFTPSGIPAGS